MEATNNDKQDIVDYCTANGFKFPESNCLYISRDNDGVINGLAGLEIVIKVEPFISDNPAVSRKLYNKIMDVLKHQNVKKVECFTPDYKMPKVKKLYEKLGFMFAETTNRFIKIL